MLCGFLPRMGWLLPICVDRLSTMTVQRYAKISTIGFGEFNLWCGHRSFSKLKKDTRC